MSATPSGLLRQVLVAPSLRLEHYLVPWDTEIFARPVAQLEAFELLGEPVAACLDFAGYERWREQHQVALEVAKLDARRMREIAFLEGRGFRWMEMQYRLQWQGGPGDAPPLDAELTVAPVRPEDRAAVDALVASAFEDSRFALDPAIGPELAGRRYRTWLENALNSGRQELLVARNGAGGLVGMFLIEQQGDYAYWHLAAVNPSQQGRGYGIRMWRHMMAWQCARGVTRIETSLSAQNLRIVGLYGRIGFRFTQVQVSLHRGGLRSDKG